MSRLQKASEMDPRKVAEARDLINRADDLCEGGIIAGMKRLQCLLKSCSDEPGPERDKLNHVASCISRMRDETFKLQAIAEDLTVAPADVEAAADEMNEVSRAAVYAGFENVPIDAARAKIDAACATLDEADAG